MKTSTRRATALIAAGVMTLPVVIAAPAGASAAAVSSVRSWSAGTVSPGQSKSYVWNNANNDIYQVNTAAVRTGDPDVSCWMEVSKQTYRRAAGAARQFLLTIRNVDTVACDATVKLALITADRSGATGVLSPGQSAEWYWNNSNVNDFVYFAGVTPTAPGSGTCHLDVTWKNRARPDGEREFVWTVRNIGSVACEGQWKLGWLPVDQRTSFPDDDPPSPPDAGTRTLDSPVQRPFRVYFFGLLPAATDAGDCEWGPQSRQMSGDPAVPTEDARTKVGYANVGSVACGLSGVTHAFVE